MWGCEPPPCSPRRRCVAGEEAALAQERLEWLRMRYLIAAQSSADTEQRMAQAMDASSRVGAAQEDLQLWLGRVEMELKAWDGREPPCSDRDKLQQFLRSELERLAGLQERLDAAGSVQLDVQALDAQLAEHKLLSAEILHHRSSVERLLGVAEPMLRCSPQSTQQHAEPSVQALQEQAEQLWRRSAARSVQLEQAQALLAQFCQAQAELQPWLEETQAAAAQLCTDASSCEAFREQQALLQCLREAVAEHRPLVAKLQRAAVQLQELNAEQAAPLQQSCKDAQELYNRIRERMQTAAAMLEEALPRYGQLSERMDLLHECLERLQGRLRGCPPLHGDAAQLRERLRGERRGAGGAAADGGCAAGGAGAMRRAAGRHAGGRLRRCGYSAAGPCCAAAFAVGLPAKRGGGGAAAAAGAAGVGRAILERSCGAGAHIGRDAAAAAAHGGRGGGTRRHQRQAAVRAGRWEVQGGPCRGAG
ncbi:microtubule-actin cross-linking factor 1, isoforms 6/7-like [Lagopus muta]|uniref:microtubule-actin cross-linking factor 1, isoforms 6/7-like n=1 Tax=Lagopus muta TaxID=64668 RepID=UPI00209DED98|nr:microtubule-actin cross-linking factor 1, isoforms 6/7-like [Lagopus muta]